MAADPQRQFSIGFEDDGSSPGIATGLLVLGDFEESFEASLLTWCRDDYRRNWREAITRTVAGVERSALITSIHDPATANFIRWWPMYRTGELVRFQEQVLFLDELDVPFKLSDPFDSVPERRTTSDDGDAISEWSLPISALASSGLAD